MCIAWLLLRQQYSYIQALAQIKESRPHANPNVGFQIQLRTLEEANSDLLRAQSFFKDRIGDECVSSIIVRQRDAANSFHARADALEDTKK